MRPKWRVLALLTLCACGGRSPTEQRTPEITLRYDVAVDALLSTMRVSICPGAAPLPEALVPIHEAALDHLRTVSLVLDQAVVATLPPSGRIDLASAPPRACVHYDVDLSNCDAPHGPASCGRSGRDLFAPTSVWLLSPERRTREAHYEIRFALPRGITVTPIAAGADATQGHVVLDDRGFAFVMYLAFVHSTPRTIAVPGGCIDVVTLDGSLDVSPSARAHWLEAAAAASTRVTGAAPFDRMTALIVPTIDVPGTPVLFGVAGRGMRPSVTLLVSEHATEAQLVRDWTAVHELSHLLTAHVDQDDVWLAEGLATYYEEVLRARQGLITEIEAWSALESGFARGRAASGTATLRSTAAAMQREHAFTRVYWQGAAIVFLADVAYRRAGGSLDEAIGRAWAHRTEHARAATLIEWLDGAPDGPFASAAAASLDAELFPDLGDAYAWLGVVIDAEGNVSLDDAAPGAVSRQALMNGGPPAASNPASCEAPAL